MGDRSKLQDDKMIQIGLFKSYPQPEIRKTTPNIAKPQQAFSFCLAIWLQARLVQLRTKRQITMNDNLLNSTKPQKTVLKQVVKNFISSTTAYQTAYSLPLPDPIVFPMPSAASARCYQSVGVPYYACVADREPIKIQSECKRSICTARTCVSAS